MQKKFMFILFVTLFCTQTAWAVREVVIRKQTYVYAKQNPNSEVLGVYDRGDRIPISAKDYGRWRKVIVDVGGKKRAGWVTAASIRGATIRNSRDPKVQEEESRAGPRYRARVGAGIIGNLSYVHQTKGELSAEISGLPSSLAYSSLGGANAFISLFGDFNLSPTMQLRGFFSMRKAKRSGSAAFQTSSGSFIVNQDLMGFGATLKMYKTRNATFWWGPSLEIAKTTKFDVKGNTTHGLNIAAEIKDDPIYFLPAISAGYDLHLNGRFFILPEVKFGLVPNGDPIIATFEVLIPIAFTF